MQLTVFIHLHRTCSHAPFPCTAHIHTTRMKSDRDYLSFHTQLKFSLCKPHAECLIQKKIHHCTIAFAAREPLGLSGESIFCRLCCCPSGMQTCVILEYKHRWTKLLPLTPHAFNTAKQLSVRGAADGHGLRLNQTPLPLALMLMMIFWDTGGIECHSACICMGTLQ